MSCVPASICGILNVDPNTAKIFVTVGSGIGCGCTNSCLCQNKLTADNTFITIRRDGPKYSPSFGCCGNPAHRVENCPILPGELSFPFPTYIVPCPNPVAPPFPLCTTDGWFYKFPPFVKYPLFSKSGSELCFFLDSLFYNVPRGRYVADLFVDNIYCDSLRLKYDKSCRISASRSQKFTSNPCADNNPARECSTDNCA